MAISRMQEPRQMYGLGSIVKKAVRGVKKIAKSPIGKAALLYAGTAGLGALGAGSAGSGFGLKMFAPSTVARNIGLSLGRMGLGSKFIGPRQPGTSFLSKLNPFTNPNLSFGQKAFIGGGLGLAALPFFMGGDDEAEEVTDVMDVDAIRQSARDYYMGTGGKNLAFMPQKKYVMENFYQPNADGGRIGYADGMMVEDDEEEFIRTAAGQRMRPKPAFLNMGGGAGQAQAEQMLMAEFVKYKNKGGTLSFEQFVKAVMQEAAPEGAGMEQPVAMAANGGRMGKQEGGIMETEVAEEVMPLIDMGGKEKDYRETGGFVDLGRKERADDVPARLSKNEFVFTADAVRNAGGGDIDKGAEVMENLMNNLEAGGQVSEESQGLEGAQAMYDQQQMLQSRMI